MPIRIGFVGLGKITIDQHIPSVRANSAFELVGAASPRSTVPNLDVFSDLSSLLAGVELDAVAINTPPQMRYDLARQALLAKKHVLLEKPPCATVAELAHLRAIADQIGVTLYTGWHSQHAPAVAPARDWLRTRSVRHVKVRWCENVRQWHPGQKWIWQAGGLGVFDPGINALSILTAILPERLRLEQARLEVPGNCQTPIAGDLAGHVGESATLQVRFDFLQTGVQTWSIEVTTDDGAIELSMGGAELSIDGVRQSLGPNAEYASIYRRFGQLIAAGASEVDAEPLALTADAFLIGERVTVADFIE